MFDQAKFIQCNDARIAYYEWGQGQPLVLLHGNSEDSRYFSKQIAVFSRIYRVIAVDSRGHGMSEHGRHPLSFALLAEDLKKVLDALHITRTHLIGFSDGGNLAITFALCYPQRVDKLVLNGANIDMWAVRLRTQILTALRYYALMPLAAHWERPRRRHEVLGLMMHPYAVTFGKLSEIRVPTLVIAGTEDMILREHTRRIAAAIPTACMVLIEGGDHFCSAKYPNRFNLAVLRFLLKGESHESSI